MKFVLIAMIFGQSSLSIVQITFFYNTMCIKINTYRKMYIT